MGEAAHGLLGELKWGPGIASQSCCLIEHRPPWLSAAPTGNSCHFLTIVTQTPEGNLVTASLLNVIWPFAE